MTNNITGVSKVARSGGFVFQLLRYGVVGLATNLLLYLAYLIVTYLGMGPKQAMSLLYIAGVIIGFFGHRKWSFMHSGTVLGSSARYLIAHLLGYLINLILLFLMVDKFGYPHQWVQGGAILVVAGFLFVVFRYFVFSNREP